MTESIYLDHNATTPVDPSVAEAMLPYLTAEFGNPSSSHRHADAPRIALDRARVQVAALIGGSAEGVIFTGSGSEADNLAIRGAVLAGGVDRPHVITQQTEHPAVLATCAALTRIHGADVTYLPVDSSGLVDPGAVAAAITTRTVLVTIMHANNETGTIQPIADIARIAHDHGALFHTDAAQTVGKIPVDVDDLGADLLTVVGHKMYAPKGVAALYRRPGTVLEPIIYGGGQEHGLRAGTENVAHAVALGVAADLSERDLTGGRHHELSRLRDQLHHLLTSELHERVALNGHPTRRLPHTLNVSIARARADELLAATPMIAASTGSACHAGRTDPSPVLTAMGLSHERATTAIRLSLGRWTTEADITTAAGHLAVAALRTPTAQ